MFFKTNFFQKTMPNWSQHFSQKSVRILQKSSQCWPIVLVKFEFVCVGSEATGHQIKIYKFLFKFNIFVSRRWHSNLFSIKCVIIEYRFYVFLSLELWKLTVTINYKIYLINFHPSWIFKYLRSKTNGSIKKWYLILIANKQYWKIYPIKKFTIKANSHK